MVRRNCYNTNGNDNGGELDDGNVSETESNVVPEVSRAGAVQDIESKAVPKVARAGAAPQVGRMGKMRVRRTRRS